MKKRYLVLMALTFIATGCKQNKEVSLSMIVPSGTPLFGISTYLADNSGLDYEITNGGEALTSEFVANKKDIIIAPINVGANMYSKVQNYVLFETYVWGNLYAVSSHEITSFSDLDGKEIAIFGENQTPDIVMKVLSEANNITYTKYLTNSVEDSTSLFNQGKVEYFIAAEPSLSKLKLNKDLYIIDLQEEWKKITQNASYPQAGIFVKKSKVEELKDELIEMKESIMHLSDDVEKTVDNALKLEVFSKLGKEALTLALPNCHFGIEENQKEAIEFYFNKLTELNLEKTFGGSLPGEEFYLTI